MSHRGHAFIDRTLYLPEAWTEDTRRMMATHVPPGTGFASKSHLARGMIERAIAADVPFAWVTAESVFSGGEIKMVLRRAGKGHVLGVDPSLIFYA